MMTPPHFPSVMIPCRARATVWVLGLMAVLLPLRTLGDGIDATKVRALKIFPERIVTTTDYPGRFAVRIESADGASRGLTQSEGLDLSILDPNIADVQNGSVVSRALGQTELEVSWDGLRARATIISEPDFPTTFSREVIATLTRSGCNLGTCHGNLHGKGGLRLSLRGDDPEFDHYRLASEYGQRRIDTWEPDASLVLRKGSGQIAHQGGQRFSISSPEYEMLRRWIGSGAPRSVAPGLVGLRVQPSLIRVASDERTAQIIVLGDFADGTTRDVTRWSRIEPSLPAGIAVSQEGWVVADRTMDVSLGITYLSGRAGARLVFLGRNEASPNAEPSLQASAPLASIHPIDRLVEAQCRQLHVPILGPTDAWTLVRRLHLVTLGRLPSPEETRAFVADSDPMRTEKWVDRLLADPAFDFLWAMRWSDLIRNEDKVMSPRGAGLLHGWLRQQSASDRSLRDWISELLSSTGSTYENPPASFHRTHRDPFIASESIAQVFLGVRMQCARCHNHPFDVWRQDDYYGLAAHFSTIDRKQIDNKPRDELDKHIITGDEIISLADRTAEIKHPGRSTMVGPRPMSWPGHPPQATVTEDGTILQRFADWLTKDNPQFDLNIANRVWYQYFGRGIVDPPDDFRDSNPPSNPELLQCIASELRQSGYSLKTLSRIILTSQTFARQTASDMQNEDQLNPIPYFAGYPIRRLPAEVLMDAISDASGVPSQFRAGPEDEPQPIYRAMQMPGIPKGKGFLTTFGKPDRLLVCECERSNQVSFGQSLAMVNGKEIRDKLSEGTNRIDALMHSGAELPAIIDELFLATLCRFPSQAERDAAMALMDSTSDRPQNMTEILLALQQQQTARQYRERRVLEDILWSLMNSKEFIMIR